MKPIANTLDLVEARSQPRAFVFLWVNWSIQARHSEGVVRELVESWAARHRDRPAPAYRADLSDQEGELWEAIREWLRIEGRSVDLLTFGGNGSLLWVGSGSVAAYVAYAAGIDRDELVVLTRGVFE